MPEEEPGWIRARPEDAEAVTALVNEAYLPAESFLYDGERTALGEIRSRIAKGTFLLRRDTGGRLAACVYVEGEGERAYLGMLSVAPFAQGRGLGRWLLAAAEAFLRARGVRIVTIEVVSRRHELFPFYEGQGYRAVGSRPFDDPRLRMPCHFVVMEKDLG